MAFRSTVNTWKARTRREIDEGKQPARLEVTKDSRVRLFGMLEVMVDAAHKHNVTTVLGKIRTNRVGFDDRDVLKLTLFDLVFEMVELFVIELCNVNVTRGTHTSGSKKRHLA